jgi:hypothetical protein
MPRSYDRDENGANRLLAPGFRGRSTHGAANSLAKHVGIALLRPRQRIDGIDNRVHDGLFERSACGVLSRQTRQGDIRVGRLLTFPVHDDGHRNVAGEGELAPIRYSNAIEVCNQPAVLVQPADIDLVDLAHGRGRKTRHDPVFDLHNGLDAKVTSEIGMGQQRSAA